MVYEGEGGPTPYNSIYANVTPETKKKNTRVRIVNDYEGGSTPYSSYANMIPNTKKKNEAMVNEGEGGPTPYNSIYTKVAPDTKNKKSRRGMENEGEGGPTPYNSIYTNVNPDPAKKSSEVSNVVCCQHGKACSHGEAKPSDGENSDYENLSPLPPLIEEKDQVKSKKGERILSKDAMPAFLAKLKACEDRNPSVSEPKSKSSKKSKGKKKKSAAREQAKTRDDRQFGEPEGYRIRAVGVCVKGVGADAVLLLVSGSKNKKKWGLPGGGVEKNESHEEAAIRELVEESGVHADVVEKVGIFKDDTKKQLTTVFLMSVREEMDKWQEDHLRRRIWVPLADGVMYVKKNQHAMLDAALRRKVEMEELNQAMKDSPRPGKIPKQPKSGKEKSDGKQVSKKETRAKQSSRKDVESSQTSKRFKTKSSKNEKSSQRSESTVTSTSTRSRSRAGYHKDDDSLYKSLDYLMVVTEPDQDVDSRPFNSATATAASIYLGACNFALAEEKIRRPCEFGLYHQIVARPFLDDLEPDLHLYLVYRTTQDSYRHYRIRQKSSSSSPALFVDCGDRPTVFHPNLDHLVRFHKNNVKFNRSEDYADSFAWWGDKR